MAAEQILRQIQDATEQVSSLEEEKFIEQEEGGNVKEIETQLEELKSRLEGLKEEYNSELRNAQDMDLGKWVDEKMEAASSIRVSIDGFDNAWLEAMCYAAICQTLQFRWSSTVMFVDDAKRRALLSPENTDAYDWYETHRDRKEQMEQLWIAAEQAYKDACERIEGDVNPPRLYNKSHERALTDAQTWFENRQAASKQAREKLVAVQNDMDKNMDELFLNALPARAIY